MKHKLNLMFLISKKNILFNYILKVLDIKNENIFSLTTLENYLNFIDYLNSILANNNIDEVDYEYNKQ